MVNRQSVAHVGNALGIAPLIRLGRGEEASGGRRRTALVSDCLEALIGAVYLDRGWDTAEEFVSRVFHDEFLKARKTDTVWDYKSRLQNHCQGEHIGLPRFEVIRSEGPDHLKEFEVEVYLRGESAGRGRGRSKKEAEQNAAREALEREGITLR
jgi:ribonuclease-3